MPLIFRHICNMGDKTHRNFAVAQPFFQFIWLLFRVCVWPVLWICFFANLFFSSNFQFNTFVSVELNESFALLHCLCAKNKINCSPKKKPEKKQKETKKMSSDELSTMYGNPMMEFLMFLVDFIVFAVRSIYFLLETFILTILPNRYRTLKVSVEIVNCCRRHTFSFSFFFCISVN